MRSLMRKEFALAMHPTAPAFVALSAMLLIPNYTYYVVFFYTTLAIFFTCLQGRENHDVFYSIALPVSRREVVLARMLFSVCLELTQMLICVPFAYLRQILFSEGNQAGMDANIAFFGFSFVLLGIFNYVFFTRYYRNVNQVGKAFVWSCAAIFLYIAVAETCTFAVGFFRNCLDTPDPHWLSFKLAILIGGMLIFAALTFLSYRVSVCLFEKQDIS